MTQEEYQQMKAALAAEDARRAEIKREEDAARIAPVVAVTGSPAFFEVKAAIETLPAELVADERIGPNIRAVRLGMENLLRFAPPPASSSTE